MTTHDALRDELARLMGCRLIEKSIDWIYPDDWDCRRGEIDPDIHPVPASLDWLSEHGLPEGWSWRAIARFRNANASEEGWGATAETGNNDKKRQVNSRGCEDSKEAFLRCCIMAWTAHNTKGTA